MVKNRQVSTTKATVRPGEGALLDIVPTSEPQLSGSTSISFGIRLGTAPVPDRKYVCDTCCVLPAKLGCQILFGQRKVGSDKLRSLVVIHLPPNGINQFVKSIDNMDSPPLDHVVKSAGVEFEPLADILEEPDQTIALSANMSLAAFAGPEACLDFYQASPFAIVVAPKVKKLALDPVVRIELSTGQTLGLLSELREHVSEEIETNVVEGEK